MILVKSWCHFQKELRMTSNYPPAKLFFLNKKAFKAFVFSINPTHKTDKEARIMVEVFSDRVEISNPGILVSEISPAEFESKSLSRDPFVFGLFERMSMVEQIGSHCENKRQSSQEVPTPTSV